MTENQNWEKEITITITEDQIMRYLIVCLIMSLVRIKDAKDHWNSPKQNIIFSTPLIIKLMTREEFFKIHTYVHFSVEKIEEKLNTLFQSLWELGSYLSIDEGLIGFYGGAPMKCFMPGKPDKHGLKYFALCENNGFMHKFFWYMGKQSDHPTTADSIVLDLMKDIPRRKHVLFCDNWYSSLNLCEKLAAENVFFTMTCRNDRPTWLFGAGMQKSLKKKGEWTCKYSPSHKLIAISMIDRKRMNMMSNCFDDSDASLPSGEIKPKAIERYNAGMGGVDLFDKFMHAFPPFPHRKTKYTRQIFFSCINMILVNGWIVFRQRLVERDKKPVSQKEFLLHVVRGYCQIQKVQFEEKSRHFPLHRFRSTKGEAVHQHCALCKSNTPYRCTGCKKPNNPQQLLPLCPTCMEKYHKDNNIC